jgi:hypothetical protein
LAMPPMDQSPMMGHQQRAFFQPVPAPSSALVARDFPPPQQQFYVQMETPSINQGLPPGLTVNVPIQTIAGSYSSPQMPLPMSMGYHGQYVVGSQLQSQPSAYNPTTLLMPTGVLGAPITLGTSYHPALMVSAPGTVATLPPRGSFAQQPQSPQNAMGQLPQEPPQGMRGGPAMGYPGSDPHPPTGPRNPQREM